MLKRLVIIIWLPVLWLLYLREVLYLLPLCIVTAGFYEIRKRYTAPDIWLIIPYIHLLGIFWLFTMSSKEMWLVIIIVFVNDVAALVGGKYFNFWKLTQVKIFPVSPKKTLGGFFYGLIFGTIAGVLTISLLQLPKFWCYVVPIICLAGVLGDLLESKFKRSNNIKDSGEGLITEKLLYGHGGVYDRFDALAMGCHVWGIYLLL
jgi:phosphatidate cytidylyltransferase